MENNNQLALGIDIGGTNIAFGLVDRAGNLVWESNFKTKDYPTPTAFVQALSNTIPGELKNQIVGVAAGAPNGNIATGRIEFAPNLHWKGIIPLAELFQEEFNVPSYVTNDANAAAIGEKIFGVAKLYSHFVTITLGTGLGSGIINDGKIVNGGFGFAGEYGHLRVINNGRLCKCGRYGCLETYASATGMVRSISELDHPSKLDSKLLTLPQPTSKDIVDLALEGDVFASYIIDYTAEVLGNALADFMCFSNPEAYVLFGGCAHAGTFFSDKVKYHMERNALNIYKDRTAILISELQDKNAAVLGTAAIVFN